ncbi:MAG: TetR/AcrR family transcriptional regulator [Microthrixaceae bacterium]|nr:TetR/AcrR family transcriptional regulator [Microthrixaceae bacterium]MCO5313662.1 TetR/AcrR family transcriptional regulator [Microthrixaceae bacterium]
MAGPGRPRRFDEAHERQLLLDASIAVMERNGFDDVAVADILAEADVSTRSFYRHFASKDELVCAIYHREAQRIAEQITLRTKNAADPVEALDAWLSAMLAVGHHPRKAKRAAILASPGARRAEGYTETVLAALELFAEPLRDTISAGRAAGMMPLATDEDVELLQSLVWGAGGVPPGRISQRSFEQSLAMVRSFAHRALGIRDA